jgi:hypothetical protein
MSSPNLGKSPVEQALCVARALIVRSPALCNNSVAMDSVLMRLKREGRFVYDEWFRVVEDRRERYITVFKGGGGESSNALPEGKSAAFTIDVRGQKPVTDAFERFVEEYERGSVLAHPFRGLSFPESRSDARADLNPDQAIVARLRKCLDACAPSYNLQTIVEFRGSLGSNTPQVDVQGHSVPLVTPEQLIEFSHKLASLRAIYAADVNLFGSVEFACLICTTVATRALASDKKLPPMSFLRLATHLRYSWVQDPLRILDKIIQQAIDDNFVALLIELAEKCDQDIDSQISEAQSSTSIDEFLDRLYNAASSAQGVHHIYGGLVANVSRLGPEHASIVPNRLNRAEEIRARVGGTACYEQIRDFDGEGWGNQCQRFRRIIQTDGEQAARDVMKDLERSLVYPTSALAELLQDAKSPAVTPTGSG